MCTVVLNLACLSMKVFQINLNVQQCMFQLQMTYVIPYYGINITWKLPQACTVLMLSPGAILQNRVNPSEFTLKHKT